MRQKIIFIGGIHGVGKTTNCQEMASYFNIQHFSAGNLISMQTKKEVHRSKEVEDIQENQHILLTALNEYLKPESWYLLDGHFCLLNKDSQIVEVPYETFEIIHPKGIITLIDEPDNIYRRLIERDNHEYDLALLECLQKEETRYTIKVARTLGVSHLIGKFNEKKGAMYSFIRSLINEY